ncbi:cyclic nucleotide-binding domain-containing protein [Spirosoma rigui]|uniref:cyclic nucleotide-binding domain-containing protein n=1 Tax=Spirosoma rigui TaxID=564064 RepID=UPI0009AF7D91|nr:cyclic nucleotide-binding domain-containing protein [Spirosoma rigui]
MNVDVSNQPSVLSFAQRWQRALGVRPDEARTVGLFFVHNFLLGIGTILVYVAANAILLENNPETNLPIAYLCSAVAMIGIGRLYGYYEHHLLLSSLATRVLLTVVAMTIVVGLLVAFGHSVAAAVAIMAGYRVVYLLTNLEFWGVSAVVFDTRQSKRLFSVISSGDMPAKALGAILAAFVHAHTGILLLVMVAFGAFLAAFYTLQLTIQSHEVHAAHRPARAVKREPSRFVGKRFGGSNLIFLMCLSLAALAAAAIEIEYNFFVNVKHRFHDQSDVIKYVSYVLALTYSLAMLVKLLLSGALLDKFGVRRSLLLLPLVALVGLVGLITLNRIGTEETVLLIYFCLLYLVFEVVRRSLFDPVFLVLFQPLSPPQRLKGHTLAKGLYEPLGLGLAGVLIWAMHNNSTLEKVVPFVWLALLIGAFYLLRKTYGHYMHELNDAIGRRFLERDQLAMPTAAKAAMVRQLSSDKPADVIAALGWLGAHSPQELTQQVPPLLDHADSGVRHRALAMLADHDLPTPVRPLTHVALTDPEPALREQAAYLLGRRISAEPGELAPLLNHTDLSIRQGGIRGVLELNPKDSAGRNSLRVLINNPDPALQQIALTLIGRLRLTDFASVVTQRLTSDNPTLAKAAITAAGGLGDPGLTNFLVTHLTDPGIGRLAVNALKAGQDTIISALKASLPSTNRLLIERIATICGTIRTDESRQLLNELASQPDLTVRGAALRALRRFPNEAADDALFRILLDEEIALAQRLLHGSVDEPMLVDTLDYELTVLLQRLFDVLTQLYDSETIAGARMGVNHPARERRANSLELLDNLIPRTVYQTMQVLVDDLPLPERVRMLDAELGPFTESESIRSFVLRTGETVFSAWTVSVVLHSLPTADALAAQQALLAQSRALSPLLMSHSANHQAHIPDYDRVLLLAHTSLFSQTPENVLASVTPIMKEESHAAGKTIFQKGDLGTGMFVIYSGEVSIRDGNTELARFGRGDFFGELALLDTEARSASAEALTDVRLLRLDQDDFFDLMEERSEVLRSIVRSLSGRIRRQNDLLAARPAETPAQLA